MILEFWTFRIKDPLQPSGPKSSTNIWVILFPNTFNNFADILYIYIIDIYIYIRTPLILRPPLKNPQQIWLGIGGSLPPDWLEVLSIQKSPRLEAAKVESPGWWFLISGAPENQQLKRSWKYRLNVKYIGDINRYKGSSPNYHSLRVLDLGRQSVLHLYLETWGRDPIWQIFSMFFTTTGKAIVSLKWHVICLSESHSVSKFPYTAYICLMNFSQLF